MLDCSFQPTKTKNEKTGHKLKSRYHFELNPVWKIQLFHLQLQANEFISLFLALKHTYAAHSNPRPEIKA